MQYKIQKLDQIFLEVFNRKLVLPDFQRDFVWKRDQQAKLISSMLNDLPSGSFLTSRMPQSLSCRDCGLKNDYFYSTEDSILLLDGQQRITTLLNTFNNICDFYSQFAPDEVYDKYMFNALKVRWFLSIDIGTEDVLGLKNFCMPSDLSTVEYENALIRKNDIKTNLNGYGVVLDIPKLVEFCKNNKLIPLFLLNDRKYLLQGFSQSGFEIVGTLLSFFAYNRLTELEIADEDELFSIGDSRKLDYAGDISILKTLLFEGPLLLKTWMQSWLTSVNGYLFNKIIKKEQMFIEIEQHSKVIDAFDYLNKAGTRLTTFDLFCAKFSSIGLRQLLLESYQIGEVDILKNNLSFKLKYSQLNFILEGEKDVNYANLYMQTVSLMYFYKNNPSGSEFPSTVLKNSYVMEEIGNDPSIDVDFILQCSTIVNNSLAFFYLNFGFNGLSEIPNKMAVIPIIWLSIIREIDLTDGVNNNIIRAHYYTTIFSGKYDSHQNENCRLASKDLINLIDNNPQIKRDYFDLINLIFTDVVGFLNFEKISNQTKDGLSSSIQRNILNFILCSENNGLVDFDDVVNAPFKFITSIDDVPKNIHHIIPLNSGTSFLQSTKEIRKFDHHRLNSVLNKTVISDFANKRVIGSRSVDQYFNLFGNKLNVVCQTHIIPVTYNGVRINSNLPLEYDCTNQDHLKIDAEYNKRFELIKNKVYSDLTNWLG